MQQAWYDHIVLLFRGQKVSDDDLIRFSRNFGELDIAPASATDMAGGQALSRPEIWIISNVLENGKPIGALGDKEAEWHTDMSYVAEPPMASVLYSLEIPSKGGDTSFANMYKALEELPDDLRAAIEAASSITIPARQASANSARARASFSMCAARPARSTPRSARIRRRAARRFISADASTAISKVMPSRRAKNCSTGSGRIARNRSFRGRTGGGSATS